MSVIIRILLFILVLGIYPGHSIISAQDQLSRDQQRAETEQELERLRQQIKELQSNQEQTRSKLSVEQKALKEADIAINRSSKTLRATQRELRASEAKLAELKEERIQLEQNKSAQQAALSEQIRAAYMNGGQEYIKVLLNQEDPSTLARSLMYYEYLNKARAERIAELKTTIERLAEVIINIDREQQQLARLEADQRAQNDKLAQLKNERQRVVSRLQRQVVSDEKKLQEWQANETDLISILDALKQQIAQIIPQEALNGLSKLRGKLNWPVNGRLKERFGRQREDSQARWSGVLIGARSGQTVQAIHHGRVVYSDYLRGFGLITIIDHGDGYMSLYGHNEALYKVAGDWVEAGERIATVGQTGGYPDTGLYFEIRHKSKALNPLRFISRS